ncbi:Methionyl-tRNA formyltransferase, mitochondrial [Colletotrichum chlorophyti]|uniref:methionyl-tRNA formyltransferase n=1 Tax=Colletotrichum chlorophyti TaxID=708187 RepID=A0A1Q8RMS0_9PEZI|nr:Methionyl-tRNA formyltransferase, mitochondrial [Colletotrichum chlorophyti]
MWLRLRSATLARAFVVGRTCRPAFRHYSASASVSASVRVSDPLRILFCGSDQFSCAALYALHEEKKRNPSLIESLDVVIRPGKLTGRGMKTVREVPLKSLASELNLPIYERDTFTGWQPPIDFNLIIAVSFGLFVPKRLLSQAKYGGLNVHPSLLPDYRGSAPLQHTLLDNRTYTGVTLQTLDPVAFDHGTVLSQTPLPGIPIPDHCTFQALHDIVTPLSAEMLVDGLRRGLHVPPVEDVGWKPTEDEMSRLRDAPKLTNHDRQVHFVLPSADWAVARQRVLGPLWCYMVRARDEKPVRLILHDVQSVGRPVSMTPFMTWALHRHRWDVPEGSHAQSAEAPSDESPKEDQVVKSFEWALKLHPSDSIKNLCVRGRTPYWEDEDGSSILIPMNDQSCLKVPSITVEGSTARPAAKVMSEFGNVAANDTDYWPYEELYSQLPNYFREC